MIRDIAVKDLMLIEKLHHLGFPLPDVNDKSYILQKAIVHNDEVVGAYFARVTTELSLILDPSLGNFTRAKLWRDVMRSAIMELLELGHKSTHVFITPDTDQHYAKILEDKLGFVRATGIPLYLEVK